MEAIAHGTVTGYKTFVCLKLSPSSTCSASKHYGTSMATGKRCEIQVQKGPEVAAECLWTQICLVTVVPGSSTKVGLSLHAVTGSCGPVKHQGISGSVQRTPPQFPETATAQAAGGSRAPLCWDGNWGINYTAGNPWPSTSEGHSEQHLEGQWGVQHPTAHCSVMENTLITPQTPLSLPLHSLLTVLLSHNQYPLCFLFTFSHTHKKQADKARFSLLLISLLEFSLQLTNFVLSQVWALPEAGFQQQIRQAKLLEVYQRKRK